MSDLRSHPEWMEVKMYSKNLHIRSLVVEEIPFNSPSDFSTKVLRLYIFNLSSYYYSTIIHCYSL